MALLKETVIFSSYGPTLSVCPSTVILACAHGLEGCKVYDSVDAVLVEESVHGLHVAEIHFHERDILASGDLLDALEAGQVAVGHIVGHDYVIARIDKLYTYVAADISGSAAYKHSLFHICSEYYPANLEFFPPYLQE